MAVTLEQVEQLRTRAEVSYEDAKRALEACDGDLLDALILLEREGRIPSGGRRGAFFTTQPGGGEAPPPPSGADPAEESSAGERPRFWGLALTVGGGKRREGRREKKKGGFAARLRELLAAALDLLRHATVNRFEVWRNGELMTSLPVLILILLVLVAYWISLPLLLLGLIFGCKYRFSGPDVDGNRAGEAANRAADKVRDAVGQVRDEFRREFGKSRRKKGK